MPNLTLTFDPWPKIKRVPPLIIHNLCVKFERVWAKLKSVYVPTIVSYCAKFWPTVDIWPDDPKSIGFLLLFSSTFVWSLKVIEQKLESLLCLQCFVECHIWPWPLTLWLGTLLIMVHRVKSQDQRLHSARYKLQVLPDNFQNSRVSCWWQGEEPYYLKPLGPGSRSN